MYKLQNDAEPCIFHVVMQQGKEEEARVVNSVGELRCDISKNNNNTSKLA